MAKPRKVEEASAPYEAKNTKRPARPRAGTPNSGDKTVRYLDDATAGKVSDKIFAERKNLLRKLAQ